MTRKATKLKSIQLIIHNQGYIEFYSKLLLIIFFYSKWFSALEALTTKKRKRMIKFNEFTHFVIQRLLVFYSIKSTVNTWNYTFFSRALKCNLAIHTTLSKNVLLSTLSDDKTAILDCAFTIYFPSVKSQLHRRFVRVVSSVHMSVKLDSMSP